MFIDLNEGVSMFQRNFIAEVKQCNAAERHIHQIEEQLRRCGFEAERLEREMPSSTSITDLMRTLEENARDLKELASNKAQLVSNYNHLVELSHVLQKCDDIFSEAAQHARGFESVGASNYALLALALAQVPMHWGLGRV